ncbi:MAG: DMT family transporter [Deltaproteobacteria bacterium]|nr:DMT family transporter [Deltaproteobacteria bacterium]
MKTSAAYLTLTLLWSGSYLAIHYILQVYPPFLAAAARIGIALLILTPLAMRHRFGLPDRARLIGPALLSGLFTMGLAWALLFWGEQQQVAPAVVAVLNAAQPLMTMLTAPFLARRQGQFSAMQRFGILLGFGGVATVFSPQLQGSDLGALFGMLAILGMAASYGIAAHLTRTLTQQWSGSVIFVWQASASLPLLLGLSWWNGEMWPTTIAVLARPAATVGLLYLGLGSTALAFLLWYFLLRRVGSTIASTVTYCMPVVSILLDSLFLHRLPPLPVLVGATVIVGSVILARHRPTWKTAMTATPPRCSTRVACAGGAA